MIENLRQEVLRSDGELQKLQGTVAALTGQKVDQFRSELTSDLHTVKFVRYKERKHNDSLRKTQNDTIDLKAELAEVEKKYEHAQRRNTDKPWAYEECRKIARQYQKELNKNQSTNYE